MDSSHNLVPVHRKLMLRSAGYGKCSVYVLVKTEVQRGRMEMGGIQKECDLPLRLLRRVTCFRLTTVGRQQMPSADGMRLSVREGEERGKRERGYKSC